MSLHNHPSSSQGFHESHFLARFASVALQAGPIMFGLEASPLQGSSHTGVSYAEASFFLSLMRQINSPIYTESTTLPEKQRHSPGILPQPTDRMYEEDRPGEKLTVIVKREAAGPTLRQCNRNHPVSGDGLGYQVDNGFDVNDKREGNGEDEGEDEEDENVLDAEYTASPKRSGRKRSSARSQGQHEVELCKVCGRTYFARDHDKRRHDLTHNKDPKKRPLLCDIKDCTVTFNQLANKTTHLKNVHATKRCRCDRHVKKGSSYRRCRFTCNTRKNLTRHKNECHKDTDTE